LSFIANIPASLIAMEACGGSHYWAREFGKFGHEVVLLNARFVKGFVVGNKNDFNDAEAIFTAATRPNKRVVSVKNETQQDLHMLHSIRQNLVKDRTATVNQTRGLLNERGIIIEQGVNQVRKRLPEILENLDDQLSALSRELFVELHERLKQLDAENKLHEGRMNRLSRQHEQSRRFLAVPGVGPITATLAAADLGDGKGYSCSRDYAASLGVVPRQHSSGGKQVLLGISKRGNRTLRTLLIHGARAVLKTCSGKTDRLSRWLHGLIERRGFNKAAVALANKNARILWAMAHHHREYEEKTA
jgi:transposase